jgi:hypothetical protein
MIGDKFLSGVNGGSGGTLESPNQRQVAVVDWSSLGWPNYADLGWTGSYEPDDPYPQGAVAANPWGRDDSVDDDIDTANITVSTQITTGVREYLGTEDFPYWPVITFS